MKTAIIVCLVAFFLSLGLGFAVIPLLKKLKAGQTILSYVEEHKNKSGTPTLGGLFFITASSITAIIVCGKSSSFVVVSLTVGLAYMAVGFIDDFIKIRNAENMGLKPYQKIIFQVSIAIIFALYVYRNGLTEFYLPFVSRKYNFGKFAILLVIFVFLATTNCVNLTDGLDGLAGNSVKTYLLLLSVIIWCQIKGETYAGEYNSLIILCASLIGGIEGFLIFNTNKASVFMGDTGSLSLGGFVAVISILSGNVLYIPIIGITFVLSGVSVIIQVIYYKLTKKRVFLMSPLHHHFELKGYSESKIVNGYKTVTLIMGLLCVIANIGE